MEVLVNVYDLHDGLGAYHAGVELDGEEWSFGGGDFEGTGVFSIVPRQAEGATYRETVNMGVTRRSRSEINQILYYLRGKYLANTYNMLGNNCITFSDEFTFLLVGQHLPQWLNRLANIANTFSMFLPDSLTGGSEAIAKQEEVQKRYAGLKPPVAPLAFSGTGHRIGGDEVSTSSSSSSASTAAAAATTSSSTVHEETAEEAEARREKVRQAALKRQQQEKQQSQIRK